MHRIALFSRRCCSHSLKLVRMSGTTCKPTATQNTWMAMIPTPELTTKVASFITKHIDLNDLCCDPLVISRLTGGGTILKPIEDDQHVSLAFGLPHLSPGFSSVLSKCFKPHLFVERASTFQSYDTQGRINSDIFHLRIGTDVKISKTSPQSLQSIITQWKDQDNEQDTKSNDNVDQHEYVPHATICFLKPGCGDKYIKLANTFFNEFNFIGHSMEWRKFKDYSVQPVSIGLSDDNVMQFPENIKLKRGDTVWGNGISSTNGTFKPIENAGTLIPWQHWTTRDES